MPLQTINHKDRGIELVAEFGISGLMSEYVALAELADVLLAMRIEDDEQEKTRLREMLASSVVYWADRRRKP